MSCLSNIALILPTKLPAFDLYRRPFLKERNVSALELVCFWIKGGHNSVTKDKLWWSYYLYQISQRMIEEEGNQKALESRTEAVLTRQTPASSALTCHQSIFEDDNVIRRINWVHKKWPIFLKKTKTSNFRILLWFLLEFDVKVVAEWRLVFMKIDFSTLGNWVPNWVIPILFFPPPPIFLILNTQRKCQLQPFQ